MCLLFPYFLIRSEKNFCTLGKFALTVEPYSFFSHLNSFCPLRAFDLTFQTAFLFWWQTYAFLLPIVRIYILNFRIIHALTFCPISTDHAINYTISLITWNIFVLSNFFYHVNIFLGSWFNLNFCNYFLNYNWLHPPLSIQTLHRCWQ